MNKQPILIIDTFGTERWWLDRKLHCEDGPAVIYTNGIKRWYLDDFEFSQHEWFQQLTPEQQENYLWNLDE